MRTKEEILEESEADSMEELMFNARMSFRYFAENVIAQTPLEGEPIKIKDFHEEWVEAFLNNRRSCVVASRGFGKTLTLSVLFPLWRSFYHEGESFLMISPTISDSKEVISHIRQYIESNEILRELKPTEKNFSWTKTELNTSTRCRIFNKPFSENVRGRQVNWVICDEIALYEDHDIFFSAVVPTTNRKGGHVMAISTPKSEGDLVHDLENLDAYYYKEYPIKHNGELLYPEEFDEKRIQEIKDEMGERKFKREYLLQLMGGEDSVIPFNYIVECFDEDQSFVTKSDEEGIYFGADFALSPKGDYTVFTTLKKREDGKLEILNMQRMRGINEDMQVQKMSELHERFDYDKMYVDSSNFGKTILNKMRSEGLPVKGIPFSASKKKKIYRKVVKAVNNNKLVIPRDKNDSTTKNMADRLTKELSAITMKKSSSGMKNYDVSSRHDDCVDALGLSILAADKAQSFIADVSMKKRSEKAF